MGIDDLLRQMQEDEEADKLETQTHATPIEYARSRGIRPQRIYYYLRNRKLVSSNCQCGRRVIDMAEADELLGIKRDIGNRYAEEVDDDDNELGDVDL